LYLFFLCSRHSQSFEFVKYLVSLCSQSLDLASLASLRIWRSPSHGAAAIHLDSSSPIDNSSAVCFFMRLEPPRLSLPRSWRSSTPAELAKRSNSRAVVLASGRRSHQNHDRGTDRRRNLAPSRPPRGRGDRDDGDRLIVAFRPSHPEVSPDNPVFARKLHGLMLAGGEGARNHPAATGREASQWSSSTGLALSSKPISPYCCARTA
jgi:hypothetical protein